MAILFKVTKKGLGRIGVSLALALFILPLHVFAIPNTPSILESEWETGGFVVNYDNVQVGAEIKLYISLDRENFSLHESWIAEDTNGSKYIYGLDNGETYYFYITQTVDGNESLPSEIYRQTPPSTVFIINWPDMFNDLSVKLQELNDELTLTLEGLFTPSQQAMDDLELAINNFKNTIGVGSATGNAQDLQEGIDDIIPNLKPPVVVDDGINTFTGGPTGLQSPFEQVTDTETGLTKPDLMSGTDTDLTFSIPISEYNGEKIEVKLFTQEQLNKFMWIGLLRDVISAAIWIMFCMYTLKRFTPIFKV